VSLAQLVTAAALVAAALSAIMALAWRIQQISGNSGWVDVTWSLGVGGIAAIAAMWSMGPDWPHTRQVAVAILAASWCLRLGLHIAERTRAVSDDPRYRNLIAQWGSEAPRRMFWFLQSQAAIGAVLALSVALAAHNPDPDLRSQDLVGLAMLVIAIVGEAAADHQLRRFKASDGNRYLVCDAGLWRWSRHPNYFFEWLSWVAYPILAIDFSGCNPYGWLALAAPAIMYWVLVHASGIPPLEQHMLRSRGDAFRAYQKRTRAFFPFPMIRRNVILN
jgi:steroid 5-alpha reductase family enzyme